MIKINKQARDIKEITYMYVVKLNKNGNKLFNKQTDQQLQDKMKGKK